LDAGKITTGLLTAARINLDGLTLENSGGQLQIKNDGISTVKVSENAITRTERAYTAASVNITDNTWPAHVIQALTFSASGLLNQVQFQAALRSASSTSGVHMRLIMTSPSSVVLWSTELIGSTSDYIVCAGVDVRPTFVIINYTFPAGSVTLQLQARRVGDNNSTASYRSIEILELKR
jgi:hypothetical protein